jgi:hypothetical protein
MLTGLVALENTDWSRLHHAYGNATDTPGFLLDLLNDEPQARQKALEHLWSAIIHQGTPWTATGPAALVVAGFLSDERLDRGQSIRANLLSFLCSVAEAPEQMRVTEDELKRMAAYDIEPLIDAGDNEALYGSEDAANAFFARAVLGCIRAAPVLMRVMFESMENPSSHVRACAAMGAVALVKIRSLRGFARKVELKLLHLAQAAQDTDERSSLVLALGDLGYSPAAFLQDPSPPVRMCAALAPSLASDPDAITVLLNVLEHNAGDIDNWFVERPP